MIAEGAHVRGLGRVIRHRHAAFAGSEMFDRMERETGDVAQSAGLAAFIKRTGRMTGIRDDGDATVPRQFAQGVVISRLARIVHRHDGAGFGRDLHGDRHRVDQQRIGFDIGENRRGAFINRRVGAGRKRDCGNDHFITLPHANSAHGAMQGRGAGIDRNTFLGAAIGGKGLLKLGNTRAGCQPARAQRFDHRLDVGIRDLLLAIRQEREVDSPFAVRHRPSATGSAGRASPTVPDWCRWSS